MKKYLLDTNVIISMFKNKGKVRQHIMDAGFQNCFISEITIAELFYGAAKGGRRAATPEQVEEFLKKTL